MQACNQESAGGRIPPSKFLPTLENRVGHKLKLLYTVQKIWAPLRKLFAPPGVISWLWVCFTGLLRRFTIFLLFTKLCYIS